MIGIFLKLWKCLVTSPNSAPKNKNREPKTFGSPLNNVSRKVFWRNPFLQKIDNTLLFLNLILLWIIVACGWHENFQRWKPQRKILGVLAQVSERCEAMIRKILSLTPPIQLHKRKVDAQQALESSLWEHQILQCVKRLWVHLEWGDWVLWRRRN